MTLISERGVSLRSRHYIRLATAWNCWFDFTFSKVLSYRNRYGDDFCLAVNCSNAEDSVYVLPFADVKHYFTVDNLEADGRRWVGTIIHNRLKLGPAEVSIPVAKYYNRFDLLIQIQVASQ